MSNTASLELCKELYELSGWSDAEHAWSNSMGETRVVCKRFNTGHMSQICPAFSAGYLLRKLPLYELTNNGLILSADYYDSNNDRFISAYGAPSKLEDILAELCIKMFKKGILPISGRDL